MSLHNNQLCSIPEEFSYLQNLETWLNNHTWEKYEDYENTGSTDSQRITRQL